MEGPNRAVGEDAKYIYIKVVNGELLFFRYLTINAKRYSRDIYCKKFINVFKFRPKGNPDQNLAGILPSFVRFRTRQV